MSRREKLNKMLEFDYNSARNEFEHRDEYGGDIGFTYACEWQHSRLAPLHMAMLDEIDSLRSALEWAADGMCAHAEAIKQFNEHPKMERAFCTCSNWVYKGHTDNIARQALSQPTGLDELINETEREK